MALWASVWSKNKGRGWPPGPAPGSATPYVSPSRAPVLSFARYFQAPATQAIQKADSTIRWMNPYLLVSATGHFGVPPGLCFKTRVGAQPLIWKWFIILLQIKLIFTRKVVHLASFWKWRFVELGSGPLVSPIIMGSDLGLIVIVSFPFL